MFVTIQAHIEGQDYLGQNNSYKFCIYSATAENQEIKAKPLRAKQLSQRGSRERDNQMD